MAKEYLARISAISGLKFKIILNKSWSNLVNLFRQGDLDILPAIIQTEDRLGHMSFTDSYFSYSDYIFTRHSSLRITKLDELITKPIALVKGLELIDWVRSRHPSLTILEKDSILDCLKSVESKEADAFMGNVAVANYLIEKKFLRNIKANSRVANRPVARLRMGIQKRHSLLISIINKSLKNLSRKEERAIAQNWIGGDQNIDLKLNKRERAWIARGKAIKYSYDPDWAPFEWKNEINKHSGIIADILHLVSERSGLTFKPVESDNWSESVTNLKESKVDMLSGLVQNENRNKFLKFTDKSIYSSPAVIVIRKDDDTIYSNFKTALKNKKIGLLKNGALSFHIKKKFPYLSLTEYDSVKFAFESLRKGNLDLVLENSATSTYFIKRLGYSGLRIANNIDFVFNLKIGVRKDFSNTALSILNKALATLNDTDRHHIFNKWTQVFIQEKTNWGLVMKISGSICLLLVFAMWNNKKLKQKVDEKTAEIKNKNDELTEFNKNLESTVKLRTQALAEAKLKIEIAHKRTSDSIEYASNIQQALIPDESLFRKYFKSHFVFWQPKDKVGGDIYFLEELRNPTECLIMVIDCTGHGVARCFYNHDC